jgi:hypothetical protein
MADVFYINRARLSFPKLVEAQAAKDQPGSAKKFGADLILHPNDPQYGQFMQQVHAVAGEKWKEHGSNVLALIQNDRRLRCYGQGGEKIDKKTYKPYEGYEDMVYVSASSNEDRPPQMIRGDGTICDNLNTMERQALARKLYGGCFVNVAVRVWPQDNQFGRAIRCELIAIQFAEDGTPFGDAPPDLTGKFGAVQAPAVPGPQVPQGFPGVQQPPWPQQPAQFAPQQPQQPAFVPGQLPPGWPNVPWNG